MSRVASRRMNETFQAMVEEMFASRGLVWPDPQDASTFLAQEAHEVIDLFLREKHYVRNHDIDTDTLEKELAQVLMMWLVTCKVADVNGFQAFNNLYEEYTDGKSKESMPGGSPITSWD